MKTVALISQVMRAADCVAFLQDSPGDCVVITTDATPFAGMAQASETRVVVASPPAAILPRSYLDRARLSRRVITRLRAGSKAGQWLETTIRSGLALTRRFQPPDSRHLSGSRQGEPLTASPQFHALEQEHSAGPIDRVVVFDVFDLPVALAFSDDNEVEVLVR